MAVSSKAKGLPLLLGWLSAKKPSLPLLPACLSSPSSKGEGAYGEVGRRGSRESRSKTSVIHKISCEHKNQVGDNLRGKVGSRRVCFGEEELNGRGGSMVRSED